MSGLLDQNADYQGLLAQINAQSQPPGFFNPQSLRLQLMAQSLHPDAPASTRAALAQGTLPPIVHVPNPPPPYFVPNYGPGVLGNINSSWLPQAYRGSGTGSGFSGIRG